MGNYNYEDTVQNFANERKQLSAYCGKIPDGAEVIEKKQGFRPFWRPDRDTPDMSLTRMTPTQTEKFIMEGKKPIPNG